MPAITISAVNAGTDTLTATAHGLFTGDRCRVRNVGGALPTGLTATVDVFAIRVDANNVKLADTNAHALAGTNILDIIGSGSGTNTIEYGLPYCIPNVVAVPLGQIFSADSNGTWAALVALYDLLTGQAQAIFSGISVVGDVATQGRFRHGTRTIVLPACSFVASDGTASIGGIISASGFITAAGASTLYSPAIIESGKTITGVTVFYNPNGGGNVTPKLRRINISSGAANDVWLGSADSTGAAIESQTNAPGHVVLATDGYQVEVAVSGAANRVHGAIITYVD